MKITITESQFNQLRQKARRNLVNENIEDELDADDVDLSSFKPKKKLADKLWKGDVLNSQARLQLLDIADDFIDFLGFDDDADYQDIILTGSICNFNWSDQSDIDVHIVYDFSDIDENTDLVRAYADAKKNEWNEMHKNLTIYGFPVELYVESTDEQAVSGGIYSLEKNEWAKKPDSKKIASASINVDEISDIAAQIATMVEELEDCYANCEIDSDYEQLESQVSELIDLIHSMRKKELQKNGEMSSGNLIYKFLRREEYLNRLYDLHNDIYDSLNSI